MIKLKSTDSKIELDRKKLGKIVTFESISTRSANVHIPLFLHLYYTRHKIQIFCLFSITYKSGDGQKSIDLPKSHVKWI